MIKIDETPINILHPKNGNLSNKNNNSAIPPIQNFLIQRPEIPVKNVFSYLERKKTINNEINNPIQSTAEHMQIQSNGNALAGQPLNSVAHHNNII